MKVVRTFHPVGQGAFYSERFYDGTQQQNAMHNIVYDCGAAFRHEWPKNHVVKQAYTDEDEIDYLFISHLDYDHVSLVNTLMKSVKRVKKIVLPLVSEEQLIIGMAYYLISLEYGDTEYFFEEIISRLGSQNDKDGENTVLFIDGGENAEDEGISSKAIEASGKEMDAPWDLDWVFIPHNVKYRSRRKELIDELDAVTKDKNFAEAIKDKGLQPIISGKELIEKLKERDFAGMVLTIPALRRAVRSAYAKIEGETNENSLLLYSGPKNAGKGYVLDRCEPCRRWCGGEYFRAGCLYTGDSTCDMTDWRTAKYTGVWDLIGTIQLPHHGSVDSFDVTTNAIDKGYIMPVSCGSYNTYGHPSGKVLAYLMVNGCCTPIVTEEAGSVYMQEVRKVENCFEDEGGKIV